MDFTNATIGERICFVRETEFKLTMEAFAEKIGMTRSAISNMEKNKRAVTDRTILSICREFNISETWLRTGNGEMYEELDIIDEMIRDYSLSDAQKELINAYLDMPNEEREVITKYMMALIEMSNKERSGVRTDNGE